MFILTITILAIATQAMSQRPSYAGISPIGFPDTPDRVTESLQDRFGEDTTPKLPIEANGDLDLIDRLSKLPIDQQPFWFINWQALEANRNNPQSYPQKPSSFVDPIPSTGNNNNVQNTNPQALANRNGVNSNVNSIKIPVTTVTLKSGSETTITPKTVSETTVTPKIVSEITVAPKSGTETTVTPKSGTETTVSGKKLI